MSLSEALATLPDLPRVRLRGPVAILLPLLLAAGLVSWLVPRDAPITQLQVRGDLQHVTPEDVRAVAAVQLGSSFFTADVAGVRNAVAGLPWVTRVNVERVWPGALAVHVWERTAVARWNDAEALDEGSHAFAPRAADIPTGLPQLAGTAGHEVEVADAWRRLAPRLAGTPFAPVGLALDPRGEWTARTAAGLVLRMGQDDPERFVAILTGPVQRTLDGRWDQVQYVDLRYTNGFAVGWTDRDVGEGPADLRADARRATEGAARAVHRDALPKPGGAAAQTRTGAGRKVK